MDGKFFHRLGATTERAFERAGSRDARVGGALRERALWGLGDVIRFSKIVWVYSETDVTWKRFHTQPKTKRLTQLASSSFLS